MREKACRRVEILVYVLCASEIGIDLIFQCEGNLQIKRL